MYPINRYNVTYKGEQPTRLAKEPTGSKVDVKPGETVNVHAVVAAQLRGSQFWTVEAAEMGEQDATEVKRKKEEAEANAKREAALREELKKKQEEEAKKKAKEEADKAAGKKADKAAKTEDEDEEDDDKNERKGKTVKKSKK